MNINCEELRRQIEQIEKEIKIIDSLEKNFTEGELLCFKNGNRYKWFVKIKWESNQIMKCIAV